MRELEGRTAVVTGAEDGIVTLETAAGILQSRAGIETTPTGGNVTCSVRPEAIHLVPADAGGMNVMRGRRIESTYLGEVIQHVVELAGEQVVKILELHPAGRTAPPGADQDVFVSVDPGDVVILPD